MSTFNVGDKVRQNKFGPYSGTIGTKRVGVVTGSKVFVSVEFPGVVSVTPDGSWPFNAFELELVHE